MKKLVIILLIVIPILSTQVNVNRARAGEKEELQWKARALIAELNLAQKNVEDFVKELDSHGFMFTQNGQIIEKPKPISAPISEPPKGGTGK